MKKLLGAGIASAFAVAAVLATSAGAQPTPNPGDGCAVTSGAVPNGGPVVSGTCTWTADVQGGYVGATDGSWSVTEGATGTHTVGTVTTPVSCNVAVPNASGTAGPFDSGAPGALQPNAGAPATCGDPGTGKYTGKYTLTVTGNGGGAIGSVTGLDGGV
jgi:hypothetical protein